MKTLLILGYVWPEPQSSAAGSRMMELIELFLSQQWNIVFASAAALSPHRADLSAINVCEQPIMLNDSSFDDFITQLQPDVVLFDRFFTEEQFGWRVEKNCPDALRILDTEDLHSLRSARHQILKKMQKNTANEAQRQGVNPVVATMDELYAVMAVDDMAQREIAAIFRCDLSLIISQFEMQFLQDYFSVSETLLCYCPFLHLGISAIDTPAFTQREHFVAIGNFRHEPNWDSVLYLKHAIWPLVRAQLPKAELHIYGAYSPPKAMQLHNQAQGFLIKGWADDALAIMQSARVCLAPLRFGAGIKGKLMDAMRTATPSVTTSIGAEAMHGDFAWAGAVADSAQDIAAAAVLLYQDPQQWQIAQQQCEVVLSQFFARERYAEVLMERVILLQENIKLHRQENFIGAMLRHHLHKSTQYMSQWIEAKNK